MADIKLNIVNQAATAAGEERMTDLTPGTVIANAAIEHYDDFVDEELENGTWKFATKADAPTLLTATVDAPLKYQWQLPSDLLATQVVLYKGVVLDGEFYDIQTGVMRCPYNSDIKVKYTYRPDEQYWPRKFRRIIADRLEALFLRVTERHSEAGAVDQRADMKTMIARHSESRQGRNRPLGDGTIIQARFGQRRRRSS